MLLRLRVLLPGEEEHCIADVGELFCRRSHDEVAGAVPPERLKDRVLLPSVNLDDGP